MKTIPDINIGTIMKRPTYVVDTWKVVDVIPNASSWLGNKYVLEAVSSTDGILGNAIGSRFIVWSKDFEDGNSSFEVEEKV